MDKHLPIFRKATRRNSLVHELFIGDHWYGISYATVIAYRGPQAPRGIRLHNRWGPTTGRHMNELGVKNWQVVSDDDFEKLAAI